MYRQQVIGTLRAKGVEVCDEDLACFSPAYFEHLLRPDKYTFRALSALKHGIFSGCHHPPPRLR